MEKKETYGIFAILIGSFLMLILFIGSNPLTAELTENSSIIEPSISLIIIYLLGLSIFIGGLILLSKSKSQKESPTKYSGIEKAPNNHEWKYIIKNK